ncbi:MAG: hypothetical protein M3407_08225 [Acidobacteriota bacterium]|nr:hypothetical protein [Acidobacteriota bacterium]
MLDECVDRRCAEELSPHEVKTVPQMGWAGIKNGQLLSLAEAEFEVFVTVDRNLSFQQNLSRYNIAVLILRATSNRLADLIPLASLAISVLPTHSKGTVQTISSRKTHRCLIRPFAGTFQT